MPLQFTNFEIYKKGEKHQINKRLRKSVLYPTVVYDKYDKKAKERLQPKFGNIPKFTTKAVFNYRKWLKNLGKNKKKSSFRVLGKQTG